MADIIIENKRFRLVVGEDAISKSFVIKANGEECLIPGEKVALFSLTEKRPFNNEVKLAHPNKRMTFEANSLRREGNKLIIGFEMLGFRAIVQIDEQDDYIGFKLVDFEGHDTREWFGGLDMDRPPVDVFRMIQLPIKERENFGEWLNVMWDDKSAVNVLGTHHFARIDADKAKGGKIMYAESLFDIQLKEVGAAIIGCEKDDLMDCIETVENDFDLPKGVKSRRDKKNLNSSMLWMSDLCRDNLEETIKVAKMGGFSKILMYFPCFFEIGWGYAACGEYKYIDTYPNGIEDLKYVINRLKEEGITPGFHFLHTHIGRDTKYAKPVADHRLNLKRYLYLAKPLGKDDDTIYVEQNPLGCPMYCNKYNNTTRILKFGGELISYESYTTEPPYCFKGCKRGHNDTIATEHPLGEIGGVLDVSEYIATSYYIDQTTSLQDEVADQLAEAYNAGMEFIYYDGSEGTNAPYEIYVPYAQYRVYKKLDKEPLFCEGAAKSHFSWHMISGGNAFDTFEMHEFKEMLIKHPFAEAPMMQKNFTRLNFGWWGFRDETRPDIYEFGTSKAAAWDCPITLSYKAKRYETNPRVPDILEVLRRWEDVRRIDWLTDEHKEMLKDENTEFTLLINEKGEYELVPYYQIEMADEKVTAFSFERAGKSYVTYWHNYGEGTLELQLDADVKLERDLGKEEIAFTKNGNTLVIPAKEKAYISGDCDVETLREAFKSAIIK